ncbi:hypothetical protein ACVB8X_18450 [Streptomyces sp. NRAIS4]
MNTSGEVQAAGSADEALARLAGAVGQPPRGMLDKAKALYALIQDDGARGADSVSAARAVPVSQVCGSEALLTTGRLRPPVRHGD